MVNNFSPSYLALVSKLNEWLLFRYFCINDYLKCNSHINVTIFTYPVFEVGRILFIFTISDFKRKLFFFCTEVHSRNSSERTCTCSTPVGSTPPSSVEACGYVKRHIMLLEKKTSSCVYRLGTVVSGEDPSVLCCSCEGRKPACYGRWSVLSISAWGLNHAAASTLFYVHVGVTGNTRWWFSARTTARSAPIRPVWSAPSGAPGRRSACSSASQLIERRKGFFFFSYFVLI